jgi:DNA-binding beta-propeller fold protein YncE
MRSGVSARKALLAGCLLMVIAGTAGVAVALTRDTAPRKPPFSLPHFDVGQAARLLTPPAAVPPRASAATPNRTRHYEYVFPEGEIDVFDIDHAHRLVEQLALPQAHAVRGIAVSPRDHMLYIAMGGDGGSTGTGSLLKFNLITDRIMWKENFPTGVDNPALTADGRTLFLPTGERSSGDVWYVVNTADGRVTGEIHALGNGPHNTLVGPSGRYVYLGPHDGNYLAVADIETLQLVRRVGPLRGGVRPFTIDEGRGLAYTTATSYLGFQVGSLRTGKVLYTQEFPGFNWDASTFPLSAPSHGIVLSPDGHRLWVIDTPNSYVHEFDVSETPTHAPRLLANIALRTPMTGDENPCGEDCERDGWLQRSIDGRYVYVGDSGDVIDTRTRKVVAFLKPLRNSRYMLELDWRRGRAIATSTRGGMAMPSSR